MDMEIKEKIERTRIKAQQFLENDIKVYIKDVNNNYYFCDILLVGEIYLYIYNFDGKRKGEKNRLSWTDISLILEYNEKGATKKDGKTRKRGNN